MPMLSEPPTDQALPGSDLVLREAMSWIWEGDLRWGRASVKGLSEAFDKGVNVERLNVFAPPVPERPVWAATA